MSIATFILYADLYNKSKIIKNRNLIIIPAYIKMSTSCYKNSLFLSRKRQILRELAKISEKSKIFVDNSLVFCYINEAQREKAVAK